MIPHHNFRARGEEMAQMTRRELLLGMAAATASGGSSLAMAANVNEQLLVAVIGVGGMGYGHVRRLEQRSDVRIAAVCDVDEKFLSRAQETIKGTSGKAPTLVRDFHRVLDDKSIDAVIIATPHHWHCPIAIRALQAGKDVYLEKPGSHVFQEGRLLVDAARKYNRILQHGTQMRSSNVTTRAGEVLASGILGTVKMSKAWNCQRHTPRQAVADTPAPSPSITTLGWDRRPNELSIRIGSTGIGIGTATMETVTSVATAFTTSTWPAGVWASQHIPSGSPRTAAAST